MSGYDEYLDNLSGWRPFEPSREEDERIEREREMNTCNLHHDCAAADEAVRAAGGRIDQLGRHASTAFHCSTEDCEDCFGC